VDEFAPKTPRTAPVDARPRAQLQRLQRDVEVLKGNIVFDWDRTAELGRVALGLRLRATDMV